MHQLNYPVERNSRGASKGYVIVSGDDCLSPILAYTEEGDFDPDNLAPAQRAWLRHFETVIVAAQAQGAPASRAPLTCRAVGLPRRSRKAFTSTTVVRSS